MSNSHSPATMMRERRKISGGNLFRMFAFFVIVSQVPIYFFLSRYLILNEEGSMDVETMALVMNDVGAAPKKIVVLGDHSSDSLWISDTLKKAFGENIATLHEILYRHEILDQSELETITTDKKNVLWVMAVRSPCEWADAMVHTFKKMCTESQSFSKHCSVEPTTSYYSMPWIDWQEPENDKVSDHLIPNNTVNQGSEYTDIFSMRSTKLSIVKQIMEANPRHVKVIQFTEFERNPNALLKDLEKEYLFQRTDSSVVYPSSTNPHEITCTDFDEWEVAQKKIDWKLEGYFGYTKFDCHLCRESFDLGSKPSNIYLLGERNSGTTFVSNTLAKAFDSPNKLGNKAELFSAGIPGGLLYKHMFRHDLLNPTELAEIKRRDDILWIMVVRSPCDWAEAMFRKPYHLCPKKEKHPENCGPNTSTIWMNHNNLAGTQLVDFFTTFQWSDWAESTHFMRNEAVENGTVINIDQYSISKPGPDYTYPNVFAMRRHKLQLMQQILHAVPHNVKFVRLNEFERGPGLFIDNIAKEFNLEVKTEYEKPAPSDFSHTTQCLTPDEWKAAQNEIDWQLEAEFGFSPHDCRMCYGYNRSIRLHKRVIDQRKRGKEIQPERFGKGGKKKDKT